MKTCNTCGRNQYLWGGESCDFCDADNSGVNDSAEVIGTGTMRINEHGLFASIQEKGWAVAGLLRVVTRGNGDAMDSRRRVALLDLHNSIPRAPKFPFACVVDNSN
jgi:hypothetical protein